MTTNSKIKDFDVTLGNYINNQIAEGIDISTVVLVLDKYLLSAKMAEMEVIKHEEEEQLKAMQNRSENLFEPDTTAYAEPAVDVKENDESITGPGSIEEDDEDTDIVSDEKE